MTTDYITEEDIAAITKVFYANIRKDKFLGPVFNAKIGTDNASWNKHIAHINDFWSQVFLQTGRFNGNPMTAHAKLSELTPEHFNHWLDMFASAAQKTLPANKQKIFNQTAKRIATSLQMGLAVVWADREEGNPFLRFDASRPSRQK